ncbi:MULTISPECIES: CPBP family intramembrane glutamic endopeptidase [Lactobacillus]|uniref:CPBP family intramembrane glutamic endopeptidase n=1 Tax=Lactobacillus TaxID=1578 RepID=UPI001F456A6E|nr:MULTISPECIES: CPBP family intramembrane glutamic endopeptidase [Lactobacillus]
MALIDLCYNSFNTYDKSISSVFFAYSCDIKASSFTILNFTNALEPGILEETQRYLMIVVFLWGFRYDRNYRVPLAVYASGIIFGLSHLSNFGWNGETAQAVFAQVIGVMGSGFLWAVLYLYTGKLWLPMMFHFLMDYLINLQTGWNSAGWSFDDWMTDYLNLILIVGVPLLFTVWMMYGKRRQALEENADRLLNMQS